MDGARNQHGYSTGNTNKINKNNSTKISPTYQPGISLWGSISISLGSWFGLGLPLAVVAEVVAVVSITQMMAIAIVAQTSIAQSMSVVPIAIGMSSVAWKKYVYDIMWSRGDIFDLNLPRPW